MFQPHLTEEPVSKFPKGFPASVCVFLLKKIVINATIPSENTRGEPLYSGGGTARLRVISFNYFVAAAYVYYDKYRIRVCIKRGAHLFLKH